VLLQARTVLDNGEISADDRIAFLGALTSALTSSESVDLPIAPAQRPAWARALISIASFLLEPIVETVVEPEPTTTDEEEEFLLTQSEFEVWEKVKEQRVTQPEVEVEEPASSEEPPAEVVESEPASESAPEAEPEVQGEPESEPASESAPEPEGEPEVQQEPEAKKVPAAVDDFEEFVNDEVIEE
jgi:hypothetical protein